MENKQLILDSLCSALQLTRDQADLEALEYKEIGPDEQHVIATYDGGGSRDQGCPEGDRMRRRTGFLQGFPERLTETIEAQGITTRQLCECTGKERKTIYAYKYGDHSPDAVTLARMCCLLQVSADYLLFGTKKK